tara:strand:- start:1239 stop:1445 length:207 start_codon:yes stop_codon:yes gene_type:complete
MSHQLLVESIKSFCLANYENGYDTCIECWGYADYVEWIEDFKVTSVEKFVESYAFMIDHANEITSTGF